MGRPKKWDELEMDTKLVLVEGWARDGLIHEQIAHNLGISINTLYEWKRDYPEFAESIKKGREVTDFMVESALLTKATGGDTTAQIFWLKNRKPDKWRDKPDSDEKLKKLIAMLAKLNLTEEEVEDLVKSL